MDRKIVVFNGETYVRNPKSRYYFKHTTHNADRQGTIQLHRAVWEYYNGKIPEGWQVHHVDGDIDNNEISNLRCMPAREHLSQHAEKNSQNPEYVKRRLDSIKKAAESAKRWHSTQEGKEWHRKHAAESIGKVRENRQKKTCGFCGSEFEGLPWSRYCSQSCQEKARRRRIGLRFEPHEKSCAFCGKSFIAMKVNSKFCGAKCKAADVRKRKKEQQ